MNKEATLNLFGLNLLDIVIMLERVKYQYNYFVSRLLTDFTIDISEKKTSF